MFVLVVPGLVVRGRCRVVGRGRQGAGGSRRDAWQQRVAGVGELWERGESVGIGQGREGTRGRRGREKMGGAREWEGSARMRGAGSSWCRKREVWKSVEECRGREKAKSARRKSKDEVWQGASAGVPEREKSGSAARALEELRGQRRPLENSGQHWERQ